MYTSDHPVSEPGALADLSPVFLRRLLGCQLVCCHMALTENISARTVGGQTIFLDTSQEKLTINTIMVKKVLSVENCKVFIMEKFLYTESKELEKVFRTNKSIADST